ncbi:uncharacterized protein N7511_008056 [Penicillium nucicola]|uniref:uncharacterized protein n=1 Tax=Penicillium nucicola TaxID=1850975 RepID=UPI00254596DF|nr:uncharacterized protein N7511_008056 [Penicillium nucicola]KAJ5753903.1 hypothetical protein N7511_008056 [Penicillium nucicola]
MRPPLTLLPLYSLLSLTSGLASEDNPPLKNANHIFNAIQDSMRQWGSSLHHNGVSFFLATVPEGTQFYHGTSKSSPVNGTEWLAFEPEHAMVFARPRRGGPPPGGPPPGDDRDDPERPEGRHGELRKREHRGPDGKQPEAWADRFGEDGEGGDAGYLHTYAAAKDLRLLYVDGMSAAKTSKGTLDSQDILLFNGSVGERPGGGPPGENDRARLACEMAETEWGGRIDGLLRMEAGFEIILCAFERDLTPLRITQVKPRAKNEFGPKGGHKHGGREGRKQQEEEGDGDDHGKRRGPDRPPHGGREGHKQEEGDGDDHGKRRGPGGPPHGGPGHGPESSSWMRAVTARYHGIGGNRVSLNYDHFVTAFSYDVELFQDGSRLPRLDKLSSSELDTIRSHVTTLITTHDATEKSRDWQVIADMVVTRYSKDLSYFVSGKISSLETLQAEIERVMSPYIDFTDRSDVVEAQRCATQFLPPHSLDSEGLAAHAVYSVAHSICSKLLEAGKGKDLESAVQILRDLVDYLDWATWKECRGCAADQLCVVPIWPMGTVKDYESPSCKDASNPYDQDGESYWGRMRH